MDGKKLPTAAMRDNKLHVDGQEHPYVRGMIRSLSLEVRDLVYTRSYDVTDGKGVGAGRINGRAIVQRGDTLAVAGSEFRTHEIPFGVRAVAGEQDEHAWTCHIGFLPYDWETDRRADGDKFYVEVYIPNEAFVDLEGAYIAGRATAIDVTLDTDLWVLDGEWYTPQSGRVTWHLVPSEKPSDMPRAERGRVERFGWNESPPSAKPPVPDEEQPAYKAGAAFADDVFRSAQADARVASEPKKRSWGLIAAWTVFILFCAGYALVKSTS